MLDILSTSDAALLLGVLINGEANGLADHAIQPLPLSYVAT